MQRPNIPFCHVSLREIIQICWDHEPKVSQYCKKCPAQCDLQERRNLNTGLMRGGGGGQRCVQYKFSVLYIHNAQNWGGGGGGVKIPLFLCVNMGLFTYIAACAMTHVIWR